MKIARDTKTMNETVADFVQNYCGAGCKIEDFGGLGVCEIQTLMLGVNPDEENSYEIATEVRKYLKS